MPLKEGYIRRANLLRDRFNPLDILINGLAAFAIWDAYHDADFVLNVQKVSFYAMNPLLQDLYVYCHFLMAFSVLGILLFWDRWYLDLFFHATFIGSILAEVWLYYTVAYPVALNIPVFWWGGNSPSFDYWLLWIIGRYMFAWVITTIWDFFIP